MENKFSESQYNSKYSLKSQIEDDLDLACPTSSYHMSHVLTINKWIKHWNLKHTNGLEKLDFNQIKFIYKSVDNIVIDENGLGLKMYSKNKLQFHFTEFIIDYSLVFCWFAIYNLNIKFFDIVQELINNIIDNKKHFSKQQNQYYKERKKVLRNKTLKKDKCKTYIMKDDDTGFYKIGKSINPEHRERTLQSQKPTIKIVKIFASNIEKELHQAYDKHRIRGEWFDLNNIQLKYICTHYK